MKFLNIFDLYSQRPVMRIDGKEKISTVFGSIIGFLSVCITLIGLLYYCYDYFAGLSFSVNFYIDSREKPSIKLNDLKIAVFVTDLYALEYEEQDRLFSVSLKYWNILIPGPGDDRMQRLNFTYVPMINCWDYKNDSLFKNETDYLGYKYKNARCFDFSELKNELFGSKRGFGEYATFDIAIQRCMNSTFKKDCFPQEVIEEKLTNFYFTIAYINNDIKLNDLNEPFKPFLEYQTTPLSISIYKSLTTEITDIRVKTDDNLIFYGQDEKKSYKILSTKESVDFKKEYPILKGVFSHFTFTTTGNQHIYDRTYKKVFNVVTDIGGFYNGIKFAAILILYIYSNNMILWHCIYLIFNESEINKNYEDGNFNNNSFNDLNVDEINKNIINNNIINNNSINSRIRNIDIEMERKRASRENDNPNSSNYANNSYKSGSFNESNCNNSNNKNDSDNQKNNQRKKSSNASISLFMNKNNSKQNENLNNINQQNSNQEINFKSKFINNISDNTNNNQRLNIIDDDNVYSFKGNQKENKSIKDDKINNLNDNNLINNSNNNNSNMNILKNENNEIIRKSLSNKSKEMIKENNSKVIKSMIEK